MSEEIPRTERKVSPSYRLQATVLVVESADEPGPDRETLESIFRGALRIYADEVERIAIVDHDADIEVKEISLAVGRGSR